MPGCLLFSYVKNTLDDITNISYANVLNTDFIKLGNIVFVNMQGTKSTLVIPEKFRPNKQRTITGLITYSGADLTHVADCDINTDGTTTFHLKETATSRTEISEDYIIAIYGTAFYFI